MSVTDISVTGSELIDNNMTERLIFMLDSFGRLVLLFQFQSESFETLAWIVNQKKDGLMRRNMPQVRAEFSPYGKNTATLVFSLVEKRQISKTGTILLS